MGLFGIGKKFNNNAYGIDKKTEWKGVDGLKEQLKATGLFTKKDIKEIKKAIKSDQLSAYMDNLGDDMKNALGLSLSKKIGFDREQNLVELKEYAHFNTNNVPKEDVVAALRMLESVNLAEDADKSKVKTQMYTTLHQEETKANMSEFWERFPEPEAIIG